MLKRTFPLALLFSTAAIYAQQSPGLTITQVVQSAVRLYPSIRVTQEQMNAAAAGVRLAQTAYLPRVDTMAQINRATRNTFYGLLLPQSLIPGVDGVHADNFGSVWDSGVGILVTWQPFDFGLRAANVAFAAAGHEQAQATVNRTQFDVSVAAADVFLTMVAAQQTAEAARAALESWQTVQKSTQALVSAQLRPGADESRIEAEIALARTQVAQAEQAIAVGQAALAPFAGIAPSQINLTAGKLVTDLPAEVPEPPLQGSAHPVALEQNAAVSRLKSQLTTLEKTYYPQFTVQGVAAARGTGMLTDGGRLGGLNGLAPSTPNYGLGLTVTFPVTDRFALREQEAVQSATIRASEAQYSLITTQMQAQFDTALATLAGARRVAANTPAEVSSARVVLQQATARYQSGLAPIDDLAQAERLLVQAQIDDALARLSVWRAKLQVETARGDIQPFLAAASQ
jgi:outer membrane protein TolC